MQAINVKPVIKQNIANKIANKTLIQQPKANEVKTENVVELTKSQSFNRFLEANSDCV